MDAQGRIRRGLAAVGIVAWFGAAPGLAAAQTPTPTATPSGAPKILLAFDASGSMATDSGDGTPKIDAAKDAAVALLDALPSSTQIGLRVFGGTLPSRPIGPACHDSHTVLPIGPLNRGQAEQQIRSFKARGRTPIAYALEQAANDLGDSGSRTIVLVSDGKDTCAPPSPCEIAQRVAKGGVEMRIQAIGFNVDAEARRELQCIATAGGGVYRDAKDAATLQQELRVLATRALREYIARGKPIKGGPSARRALPLQPGRYLDKLEPDTEHWYAVDLRRGETLQASASIIPPNRDVADTAGAAEETLDIVTPSFNIPDRQNSSAAGNPFERRGFVFGVGVVSRPIGVGSQADPNQPFSQPGRYYLKLRLNDTGDKALFNATGGQPYAAELAVTVLGRKPGAPPPTPQEQKNDKGNSLPDLSGSAGPQEPPSTALLALVGGGLAALGFSVGALTWWRRRS